MYGVFPIPLKALENSRVFRIHREEPNLFLLYQRHDQMPCCDQSLFVGQGNILSRFNRCYGWPDADHSHHSCNHQICILPSGRLHKALHPAYYFYIHICQTGAQFFCPFFIPEAGQLWLKFPYLTLQKLCISPCGQGCHLNILIVPHHFQCLGSDRSCGTQNRDLLYHNLYSPYFEEILKLLESLHVSVNLLLPTDRRLRRLFIAVQTAYT